MPPAARFGDMTTHGGAIVTGEPTVLIGGRVAARKGDSHLCPKADAGVPHVGGSITSSSRTVLIGGKPAARFGDMCGCPSAGASGAGAPPVVGPGKPPWRWSTDPQHRSIEVLDQLPKSERPHGPHAELEFLDTDRDGQYDTMRYWASVSHETDVDAYAIGPLEYSIRTTVDGVYTQRTLHWSPEGFAVEEEAGVVRIRQEMVLGPRDHPERNPLVRRETEVKILALDGSAVAIESDDRTEYGLNAEAQLVSAEDGVDIPVTGIVPWLFGRDMRLNVSVELGIDAGGGASIGDYHDEGTDRHHYRFYWGLGGPVDLQVDFSVGKSDQRPEPVVSWPNVIVTGEATVLIG